MAKYLQMNGTSDYISIPSFTFDKIVLDFTVISSASGGRILEDSNVKWASVDGSGNITTSTPYTASLSVVTLNSRSLLTITASTAQTVSMQIFRNSATGIINVKGNIYDIKIYNDTTLVAHYDMTTGTVNDQSGNGYNATLTGGTWADNGVSRKAIVFDDFNRADNATSLGNAVTGQAWTLLNTSGGTWGIQANQAYIPSATAPTLAVIDSSQSDVKISNSNYVTGTGAPSGLIAFRASDLNNYWLFRYYNGSFQLYKFVNSTATLIASSTQTLSVGTQVFTVIMNGSSINCLFNGSDLFGTITDSFNQTATKHGLRHNAPITGNTIDNFLVTDINTIVYDSFNRADGYITTTDTGQSWQAGNGDHVFSIYSNQLIPYANASMTNPIVNYVETGIADISLEVEAVVNGIDDYYLLGLRYDPTTDSGVILHANNIKLQTFTGSSYTTITDLGRRAKAGSTYRLDVQGSNYTVYEDGVKIMTATTTFNQSMTKHGIFNWRGGASNSTSQGAWDNLSISKLASSGSSVALTASDTATTTETASLQASKPLTANDTATTTETASLQASKPLTANDTTTTAETATMHTNTRLALTASDSLTASDTVSLKASKPLTASDTTTATDTISLKASKPLTASGTTTTTDSATMSVKISNMLSASDHVTTTDTANLKVSKPLSAQDTTTIADTANLKASKSLSAHDTGTATDSASLSSHTTLSASDSVSTSETARLSKVIYLSANDGASLGDSITLAVKRGLKGQDNAILVDSATIQMSKAMRAQDSEVFNESAFLGVSVMLGLNPDNVAIMDSAELLVSSVAILNRLTIPGAWGITRQVSASWQTEETVGATWAIEATRKGSV